MADFQRLRPESGVTLRKTLARIAAALKNQDARAAPMPVFLSFLERETMDTALSMDDRCARQNPGSSNGYPGRPYRGSPDGTHFSAGSPTVEGSPKGDVARGGLIAKGVPGACKDHHGPK